MSAARERVDSGVFSTATSAARSSDGTPSSSLENDRAPLPPASERELMDVPAAVVCAMCGEAECIGCEHEATGSGVVAIVAWERQRDSLMDRLWLTSRAATRDAEAFFALLPDGPIAQALGFAVLAESLAVLSFAVTFALLLCAIAWPLVHDLMSDQKVALLVGRGALLGLPAIVLVLVIAHVVHGLFIDVGARRAGAKGARRRAVRYGLYATGWDLVLAPAGIVIAIARDGIRSVPKLVSLMHGLPTRSSAAFLRGTYRIDGPAQRTPLMIATLGAIVATFLGAFFIFALVVCYMLS